ncbi:MAG: response regulator transcription factor [Ignavibacteria bacterium]|nr:response regulator transcription factor [Ignavibacteria bacterium]
MNILIADDERIITDLVTDLLTINGFDVTATNSTNKAIELINQNSYDIVLLDMFFPNQEGTSILKNIVKSNPQTKVLFLSSNFNSTLIRKTFELGAMGYISKKAEKEEILLAINNIAQNKKYICKSTTKLLLDDSMNEEISELSIKDKLTPREIEVLKLIAEGLTSSEIAETLFISPKTVETHKTNMMEKFDTNKTIKLIKIAFENNLI